MRTANQSELEFDRGAVDGTASLGASAPAAMYANCETCGESFSCEGAKTSRKSPRGAAKLSETLAFETLLTFAQAARALGISLRQFRRLVDGGRIAFVKVSERSPRIAPSELQRFLAASVIKYSEAQP